MKGRLPIPSRPEYTPLRVFVGTWNAGKRLSRAERVCVRRAWASGASGASERVQAGRACAGGASVCKRGER
eukprot:7377810-Prymnesium_polylepis.1